MNLSLLGSGSTHTAAAVPLSVTLLFCALLAGLILCLALEEKLHAKKSIIAGIAAWFTGSVGVIGVEPRLSPTLTMALEAGAPVDAPADGVAADSLAPLRVGELVLPIAQAHVAEVILVDDEEIIAAQKRLWDVARVIAEPGGAAAAAGLLSGGYTPEPDEHVGILVSGANTDAVAF